MARRNQRDRRRLGRGASCTVLWNYLRPTKFVKEHNPNFTKTDRLSELIAVRRETTTRNGHTFEAVYFEHHDFDGLVHAARRYVKVDTEGDPYDFWGSAPSLRRG